MRQERWVTRICRVLGVGGISLATLLAPASALAASCWTDETGARYAVEFGVRRGATVAVTGFRRTTADCLPAAGGVEPLTGTAILPSASGVSGRISTTPALIGWTVYSADEVNDCTVFHETLVVNAGSGMLTGTFQKLSGERGATTLTPSACPVPAGPESARPSGGRLKEQGD